MKISNSITFLLVIWFWWKFHCFVYFILLCLFSSAWLTSTPSTCPLIFMTTKTWSNVFSFTQNLVQFHCYTASILIHFWVKSKHWLNSRSNLTKNVVIHQPACGLFFPQLQSVVKYESHQTLIYTEHQKKHHFFRAILTKIQRIKMTHNWAQISSTTPYQAHLQKTNICLSKKKSKMEWNHEVIFEKSQKLLASRTRS